MGERDFCRSGYRLPEALFAGLTAEYAADCHGCGELSVSVDEIMRSVTVQVSELCYFHGRKPIIFYGGIL